MDKKIKFAIIGCGRVAGHHARSMAQIKNGELTAVCDLVKEKAESFGKEFGVPFYVSYNEMLKKHDVDVVNIIHQAACILHTPRISSQSTKNMWS
ncbi:MAG: Gfo/Idh/MocA family oxidoreductase [Candidatus Margulisiibacteriota bacterium]